MSDAIWLIIITVVLIALAAANRLRLLGRCGTCGNWGETSQRGVHRLYRRSAGNVSGRTEAVHREGGAEMNLTKPQHKTLMGFLQRLANGERLRWKDNYDRAFFGNRERWVSYRQMKVMIEAGWIETDRPKMVYGELERDAQFVIARITPAGCVALRGEGGA